MDVSEALLKPGSIISEKWEIVSQIGKGAFGITVVAKNLETKVFQAIKFEIDDVSTKGGLLQEVKALQTLQECPNICRVITWGKYHNWKYMVMHLLGENLVELQTMNEGGKFSLLVVLQIILKALYCLEGIHKKGFVHRDIKPSNFVIGLEKKDRENIYLIDFGIAKCIIGENGEIKKQEGGGFRGTNQFASVNSHMGRSLGKHDDLWSLFYMACDFIGFLPWKNIEDRNKIGEAKKKFNAIDSIPELPQDLLLFRNHIKTLTSDDMPNYELLKKLLKNAIVNEGGDENTIIFPWIDSPVHSKFGNTICEISGKSNDTINTSIALGFFPQNKMVTSVPSKRTTRHSSIIISKSGIGFTPDEQIPVAEPTDVRTSLGAALPQSLGSKWIGNFANVKASSPGFNIHEETDSEDKSNTKNEQQSGHSDPHADSDPDSDMDTISMEELGSRNSSDISLHSHEMPSTEEALTPTIDSPRNTQQSRCSFCTNCCIS